MDEGGEVMLFLAALALAVAAVFSPWPLWLVFWVSCCVVLLIWLYVSISEARRSR